MRFLFFILLFLTSLQLFSSEIENLTCDKIEDARLKFIYKQFLLSRNLDVDYDFYFSQLVQNDFSSFINRNVASDSTQLEYKLKGLHDFTLRYLYNDNDGIKSRLDQHDYKNSPAVIPHTEISAPILHDLYTSCSKVKIENRKFNYFDKETTDSIIRKCIFKYIDYKGICDSRAKTSYNQKKYIYKDEKKYAKKRCQGELKQIVMDK